MYRWNILYPSNMELKWANSLATKMCKKLKIQYWWLNWIFFWWRRTCPHPFSHLQLQKDPKCVKHMKYPQSLGLVFLSSPIYLLRASRGNGHSRFMHTQPFDILPNRLTSAHLPTAVIVSILPIAQTTGEWEFGRRRVFWSALSASPEHRTSRLTS